MYLLAKIGVDTVENEPLEVWGEIFNSIFTSLLGLEALTSGNCPARCAQAINTYIMPVADRVCACESDMSRLLRVLAVNARTLLSVCDGNDVDGAQPTCVQSAPAKAESCPHPHEYRGSTGCRVWDWEALDAAFVATLREPTYSKYSVWAATVLADADLAAYASIFGQHKSRPVGAVYAEV